MENFQKVWEKLDEECNKLYDVSAMLYGVQTIILDAKDNEEEESKELDSAYVFLNETKDKLDGALNSLRAEQDRIAKILHPEKAA